jgi:hypothetical protein
MTTLETYSGINYKIKGFGTISFTAHDWLGKPVHVQLLDVLYVPKLATRIKREIPPPDECPARN